MLIYLFKVSVIWIILLLFFELIFKKNAHFKLNRIYLFTSILTGILIPLLTVNLIRSAPAEEIETKIIQAAYLKSMANTNNTLALSNENLFWNWSEVLALMYLAGMAITLLFVMKEIILVIRKAVYGNYQTILGHKIFNSTKLHAPFSFMGWIFISHPEHYSAQELQYILKHEDAHNREYHWLDMIMIQLLVVVFWFHPLIWRFRYLLKLNHEFEADQIAASGSFYEYGHFLLEQTLLKGTPAIAHSFHFSPIKNRITMLTQKRKSGVWKYALLLPMLCGITVLFAKSAPNNKRVKQGDITTYNGHRFYWTKQGHDTVWVQDIETGETIPKMIESVQKIYKADADSVYSDFQITIQPQFRYKNKDFSDYVTEQLKANYKGKIDSVAIARIRVTNVVINTVGKIIYYELNYMPQSVSFRNPAVEHNAELDPVIDHIISNCPNWLPGVSNGKEVNTYIEDVGEFMLGTIMFRATPVQMK